MKIQNQKISNGVKKLLIIFMVFGFFLIANNVQAGIFGRLPKVEIMPDNPLYVLKMWYEKIIIFISFGDAKRAERYSKLAEERLREAEQMTKRGKEELAKRALAEYEKYLNKALEKTEELKKQAQEEATNKAKEELNRALEKVSESTLKNQEVLLRIYQLVPEPAKEAIEGAIKLTRMGYERATEAVSGIKKEELQQKAEEIKIRAQELIKNWRDIFGE